MSGITKMQEKNGVKEGWVDRAGSERIRPCKTEGWGVKQLGMVRRREME